MAPAWSRTRAWICGRAEALGGRIVGHRLAAGGGLGGDRVALDAEPVASLVLAVQEQPRAGRVALGEPGLVEERGLHDAAVVGHRGLDQRTHSAPAYGARGDAPDLDDHGRRLPRDERCHRARLATVARQVLEQVADREQAEGESRLLGSWRPRASAPRRGARGAGRRRERPRARRVRADRAWRTRSRSWPRADHDRPRGRDGSLRRQEPTQPTAATSSSAGHHGSSSNSTSPTARASTVSSSSGASAPRRQVISSASSAKLLEHAAQRVARLAPGDELLLDEADRVALAEAALLVVASGRGDGTGADALRASRSSPPR